MRKNVFGRQLKRDKNERTALFRNLMSELVIKERIQTTEQKAKAIKGEVEKLVTKARKGALAKKLLEKRLNPEAVSKMLSEISPRFSKRSGGYTKIIKLGRRFGDNASMVVMEWVEKAIAIPPQPVKKVQKGKTKEEAKPKKEVKKPVKKETKNKKK